MDSAPGLDRSELALHHPASGHEPAQHVSHDRHAQAEPVGDVSPGEGAVGPGVPSQQVAERIGDLFEERLGHSGRQRHAQGVS